MQGDAHRISVDILERRQRFRPAGSTTVSEMAVYGVRREKATLSSGCEAHPALRSSRKQSEQSWSNEMAEAFD
jgi:hypothetical protein